MAEMAKQQTFVLGQLLDFQETGTFSDLTVHLKDGIVPAVKVVFASMSPVFRTMLTTDMAERLRDVVHLPDVTVEIWKCITRFCLSNTVLVTTDNVIDVIIVSDLYQLTHLKTHSSVILSDMCCADNCLTLMRFAKTYDLPAVAKAVKETIQKQFSTVCSSEEFLSLKLDELMDILSDPGVEVQEDCLCLRLMSWLENKQANHEITLHVFSQIRLAKLSEVVLKQLTDQSLAKNNGMLTSMIQREVLARQKTCIRSEQTVPRRRGETLVAGCIWVIGRARMRVCIFCWSAEKTTWICYPSPAVEARFVIAAAKLGESFVVTGNLGDVSCMIFNRTRSDIQYPSNICLSKVGLIQKSQSISANDLQSEYSTLVDLYWSRGPNLVQSRYGHGMTTISNSTYVVGGSYGHKRLSSIEKYDLHTDRWNHVGDLRFPTCHCGTAAVGESIVVVGGFSKECQDIIQVFNVDTGTSTVLEDRLLNAFTYVRGVSVGGASCFVGSSGNVLTLRRSGDTIVWKEDVYLENFGRRVYYGICCDGWCICVLGGGSFCKGSLVNCYSLQGEILNCEVSRLPDNIETAAVVLSA